MFAALLKHGKQLQHTDKQYFAQRVRQEFIKNKDLEEKDIPYCIKQGRIFLLSKNVV